MSVLDQALICKVQSLSIFAPSHGDRCQIVEAHLLHLIAPAGLIETVIRFIFSSQIQQAQSQIVHRLAVIGVRCHHGGAFYRRLEIRHRCLEAPASHQEQPVRIVHAHVARISLQSFQIIWIRKEGGMAVLFDMLCCQQQLFIGQDLLRLLRLRGRLRHLRDSFSDRLVFYQDIFCIAHYDPKRSLIMNARVKCSLEDLNRRQFCLLRESGFSIHIQIHTGCSMRSGRVCDHMRSAILIQFQVHSRVDRGILHSSYLLVRHEVLCEGLLFKRLEP